MSVIYSPHGVSYDIIKPYASSHLVNESALPLSALIHSFDRVENPWYLGGNISAGSPGGLQIARNLLAQSWISAHDADKANRGISVKKVRLHKFTADDITNLLERGFGKRKATSLEGTKVVTLGPGEEYRIEKG